MWILRTGAPWRDLPRVMVTEKILTADSAVGEIIGAWEDILNEMIEEPI